MSRRILTGFGAALLMPVLAGAAIVLVHGSAPVAETLAAADPLTAADPGASSATSGVDSGAASGGGSDAASDTGVEAAAAPAAGFSEGSLDVRRDVPDRQAALTTALAAYAATAPAQFAVAVLDHRTGLAYSYHGDLLVRTASVVKLDILAAVILQAQDAGRGLTTNEQNLADSMIRESDNDAASTLWWSVGGTAGVAAADARLGLTGTTPGEGEYWRATTTTVADRIRLLDVIADPTGPLAGYRDYVLGLMTTVVDDQDWGVSAAGGEADTVALKNGWIGLDDGWTVNSVGRITGLDTDISIAILSQGQPSYPDGVASVEQIATLTRTALAW